MAAEGTPGESFGTVLRLYRSAANLTQEELAERSGLSVHAVSMLERGVRRAPRPSTVELLATALGLDAAARQRLVAAVRWTAPAAGPGSTNGAASAAPGLAVVGAGRLRIPTDLRPPPTPLVGRERVLDQVRDLLRVDRVRLLTLTGSPGSGKTRLALEIAMRLVDEYADGAVVVALGPLGDHALVMPAVRQALGLDEAGGEPALDTIAAHWRGRELLLVLDNFEQLLAAGPDLVELLARCPTVQLLVTSRAAVRVRAEREFPVLPLTLPLAGEQRSAVLRDVASVSVFVDRATAVAPGFRMTDENAGAVAEICRRLDGLPLALELAAPWIRLLTADELLHRLDHRLELLVDGPRDLPERQRTMRATLKWSCDLLPDAPRTLFRRLSAFAGSAPLDGLEQVCRAAGPLPGGVLSHLAVLVDHGLAQRQEHDAGVPRVTLLESIREYGRELLGEAGELESTARAHLDLYVELAVRAGREIRGRAQRSWLERLRLEHDNVRLALGWAADRGQAELGLRLASALWLFWDYGGHRQEGVAWLERLLACGADVSAVARADGHRTAGFLSSQVGAYDRALGHQAESLAIFRELGDARGVAEVLRGMAQVNARQGRHGQAIPLFEEAVALCRDIGDPELLATALMNLGVSVGYRGDPGPVWEEALALQRELADELGVAMCLVNMGSRALAEGRLDLARARLVEAVGIARRQGSPYHLAAALATLGSVDRAAGDVASSRARFQEALALFTGLREPLGIGSCLRSLGWLAWRAGRPERAVRLYGAAAALYPGSGAEDEEEQLMHVRATAALQENLGDEAFTTAREAGARLTLDEAAAEARASE